jgi:hypothetical protein
MAYGSAQGWWGLRLSAAKIEREALAAHRMRHGTAIVLLSPAAVEPLEALLFPIMLERPCHRRALRERVELGGSDRSGTEKSG